MSKRTPTSLLLVLTASIVWSMWPAALLEAAGRRAQPKRQASAEVKASANVAASTRPARRGRLTRSTRAQRAAGTSLYSTRRVGSSRLRRARSRAAQTARELNEAVLPRYKVDAAGELVPDLRAEAAIVYNPVTRQVLWEENSLEQRSIASITKLMTAVVFVERDPDLGEVVEIIPQDVSRASTTYLRRRDRLTTGDLLSLLLVASDNAAARALARVSPHGSEAFIARMNEKAVELGLTDTRYTDPSGLFSDNISSAYDMARLITIASQDVRLAAAMQAPVQTVRTHNREISVRNTSHLLVDRLGLQVKGAKTGFISRSGYCVATLLRLPQSEQEVAVVVLGAHSNAGRFLETRNLIDWFAAKTASVLGPPTSSEVTVSAVPVSILP